MKSISVLSAVMVAAGAMCAAQTNTAAVTDAGVHPAAKRKISPERLRETLRRVNERKTGGIVRKPGSAAGAFVVLNAQNALPTDVLASAMTTLDRTIHVNAKIVPTEAAAVTATRVKEAIGGAGGALGVALVEGGGAALVVAPEDGWAVIDVSALRKDGADADTLAARVRKEVLRAFAFLSGGAYMAKGEPLMRDVRTVKDLDAVAIEQFGIETITRLRESAALYGLVPWRQATYRRACEEGWAPAPTNDVQRAIWEQTRADKERGPANAIRIPPPSARK